MVKYYRRFVQDFFKIMNLLTCLTRKDIKLEWSNDCDEAFLELKQQLSKASVLVIPNSKEPYVIYIDASLNGLVCVLMQHARIVAYG